MLNMIYWVKKGFGPPNRYLCANVEKVQLMYGQVVQSKNCVDYLKRTIENVDNSLGVHETVLMNYGDGHRPY